MTTHPETKKPTGCVRCTTPEKCSIYGCCPNTWPSETQLYAKHADAILQATGSKLCIDPIDGAVGIGAPSSSIKWDCSASIVGLDITSGGPYTLGTISAAKVTATHAQAYRLARKQDGTVVLQGAFAWNQGSKYGVDWQDIPTWVEPPKDGVELL